MPTRQRTCFHLPRIMALAALAAALATASATLAAEAVTIGNLVFVNKALVGVGRLPAGLRDKFGETFGSGSGIAVDPKSWTRTPEGYQGTFYMLPDRGFNVSGTIDYRARINKLAISFKPLDDPDAVPLAQRQKSVVATLLDTILLTDAAGEPLSGLDPSGVRVAANGLPDLPQAANGRISIDSESLVLLPDGSFFVGDEYGPYVYRFSPTGRLLAAIRPPEAFVPKRKGKDDFSSNNPGPGAQAPEPGDPESGRQNNQGFEGLTLTPPRSRFLVVAMQSATRQDGGTSPQTRRYARLLYYDITDPDRPKLAREHVIPLPMFEDAQGRQGVAAQSELVALDETFFLLLCRDAAATAPAAPPRAIAASNCSTPLAQPTSRAHRTTAPCRSRPMARWWRESCRRRLPATSTSMTMRSFASSACTTASRTTATISPRNGRV